MNPILLQFLTLMIPVIVGIVAVPAYDLLQEIIVDLKKLPAWVTQLIVLIIPLAANLIFQQTGVMLPTSLGGLNSAAVGTVISSVLMYILKLAQKAQQNSTAIATTNDAVNLAHQSTLNAIQTVKVPDITVNTGKSK